MEIARQEISKIGKGEFGLDVLQKREFVVENMGRISFGQGSIDASLITVDEALQLSLQAAEQSIPADYLSIPGNCMDGREDKNTLDNLEVGDRPKVPGGPVLFAYNVAELGNFSIIQRAKRDGFNAFERLQMVSALLTQFGTKVGAHQSCLAIQGEATVLGTFNDHLTQITEFVDTEVVEKNAMSEVPLTIKQLSENLVSLKQEIELIGSKWAEEQVLNVISDHAGNHGVAILRADPEHPNHSHEEGVLIRNRRSGVIIPKRSVDHRAFVHNIAYGNELIDQLAVTQSERAAGRFIGECVSIATVATIGNNQHVVDIRQQ